MLGIINMRLMTIGTRYPAARLGGSQWPYKFLKCHTTRSSPLLFNTTMDSRCLSAAVYSNHVCCNMFDDHFDYVEMRCAVNKADSGRISEDIPVALLHRGRVIKGIFIPSPSVVVVVVVKW